jgi:predicted amino acid dehydrogenase
MYKFAWIGYFPDNDTFVRIMSYIKRKLSQKKITEENILSKKTPVGPFLIGDIFSDDGKRTEGLIIITPFLLRQFSTSKKEEIIEKVCLCVDCALKNGAQIICLAGVLGDFVPLVREKMKKDIYIITGRKLLIATIIDNLMEIAKVANIDLNKIEVTIFDTNSPIARICAQILVDKVKRVRIFDRKNKDKDDFIEFKSIPSEKLKITNSIKEVLKGSKFVISTYLLVSEEMIESLESKSVFLDTIVPFWGARTILKERKDVLPIEAAWVTRGPLIHKEFDILFPKNAIVACIAEATTLGLQNLLDHSITEFTPKNVAVVSNLAKEEGFSLADFRCGDAIFREEIKRIGVTAFR